MKTIHAHAHAAWRASPRGPATRELERDRQPARPAARGAAPAEPVPSIAEIIRRHAAAAGAPALPPGVCEVLNPAHPAAETILGLSAPLHWLVRPDNR